jgi:integrase
MKPATILRIHSIISSALDLAVRYDWADRNVAKNARPPHPRKREPDPPSPDQAARLLNLVWTEDEDFGLYLWTAFTTGARRGEVSALRENRFDFTRQQVRLARNYLVKQGQHIEKAPKDGEGRVLSLDLLTCELLQERFQRRRVKVERRVRMALSKPANSAAVPPTMFPARSQGPLHLNHAPSASRPTAGPRTSRAETAHPAAGSMATSPGTRSAPDIVACSLPWTGSWTPALQIIPAQQLLSVR